MRSEKDVDTASAGASEPATLPVTLRAERSRSAVDEPLELHVTTSSSGSGAALLTWNTPFESMLSADAFEVTRDGESVVYLGRMVKRATPPPEEAIVRLVSDETLERTIDLSRFYAVDEPGTYAIALREGPVAFEDPENGSGPFARLVTADGAPVTVERHEGGTE